MIGKAISCKKVMVYIKSLCIQVRVKKIYKRERKEETPVEEGEKDTKRKKLWENKLNQGKEEGKGKKWKKINKKNKGRNKAKRKGHSQEEIMKRNYEKE